MVRPDRASSTPLVPPQPNSAALIAKLFRGLGDPTRVRILQLLADRERSAGQLVEEVEGLQGRVSSHLACLRWCGLVTARREGRNVYYHLADPRVRTLLNLVEEFLTENAEAVELCQVIDSKRSC